MCILEGLHEHAASGEVAMMYRRMIALRMLQIVHQIAMLVVFDDVGEQEGQDHRDAAGAESGSIFCHRDASNAVCGDEECHGVEHAEMHDGIVSTTGIREIVLVIVSATEFEHIGSAS